MQVGMKNTYLPMKMKPIECSETSAYKIQTPGNYPEEGIGQLGLFPQQPCFETKKIDKHNFKYEFQHHNYQNYYAVNKKYGHNCYLIRQDKVAYMKTEKHFNIFT